MKIFCIFTIFVMTIPILSDMYILSTMSIISTMPQVHLVYSEMCPSKYFALLQKVFFVFIMPLSTMFPLSTMTILSTMSKMSTKSDYSTMVILKCVIVTRSILKSWFICRQKANCLTVSQQVSKSVSEITECRACFAAKKHYK